MSVYSFYKSIVKSTNRGGFTLVELLVSIGLFVFMTALLLARFNGFNSGTILTNLAYDIAMTIRTAQSFGVSVKVNDQSVNNFNASYGVNFDLNNPGVGSKTFSIFNDGGLGLVAPDGIYRVNDDGEFYSSYNIKRGAYISSICVSADNSNCSVFGIKVLNISFRRPSPEAIIYASADSTYSASGNYNWGTSPYSYAAVTINSGDNSASKTIVIRQNGQISVSNTTAEVSPLSSEISLAQSMLSNAQANAGTGPGQFPPSAITAFQAALASAQAINASNPSTLDSTVALSNLKAQESTLIASQLPDNTSLSTAITNAQNIVAAAQIDTNGLGIHGAYTQANVDLFNQRISAANNVYHNPASTQADITNALSTLNGAISYFQSQKIPTPDTSALATLITTSQATYGSAVEGTAHGQYAVGSKATFLTAINATIAVRDSNTSTQAQVNTAVTNLNTAVTAFNNAKVPNVSQSYLDSLNSWLTSNAQYRGMTDLQIFGSGCSYTPYARSVSLKGYNYGVTIRDSLTSTDAQVQTATTYVMNTTLNPSSGVDMWNLSAAMQDTITTAINIANPTTHTKADWATPSTCI